ncbi:hypothetical protein [Kitasatospora sp. NPDC087271]|uniref:hypothetical protein n=1 Tax=Kitasatospora sp. NPDC087271 TaxID=3364067 RepID=UPI003826FB75
MASRIQRPRKRRMLSLTVQGSEQPSPHFMTVTLGGEDVQHLERAGYVAFPAAVWGAFAAAVREGEFPA